MGFHSYIAQCPKIFIMNELNIDFVYGYLHAKAASISMPPTLSVVPAPINYTNITGAAVVELLRDGDQNLPVLFSANNSRIVIDFGAGVTLRPSCIALINHNCFNDDDEIKLYAGNSTPASNLIDTHAAPNRSVDISPLFRANDAFVIESSGPTYRYWEVEFHKDAAVLPYCGEAFLALHENLNPYPLDNPGVNYGNIVTLQRQSTQRETMGGARVNYDLKSALATIDLSSSEKGEVDGSPFLEALTLPTAVARRLLPANKTVLVFKEDKSAIFGKIVEGESISYGEKKSARSYTFQGELPNQFIVA